jgi:phosphatidylinositol glycan class O
LLQVSGIYFFTKGFLLTRLVLDDKSSCVDPPIPIASNYADAQTIDGGCWHPKTFSKAVVIIIDALRYDFTVPFSSDPFQNDDAPDNTLRAYHNALPFLHHTAVSEPQNAILLPFIADPPTTTLQRLKGLTTGTLPTFVDAGSNFAGTAIEEDNLLMQLRALNKKIVHLGDDTWNSLFPGYFEANISRAYDSFNVWDLHTVDDGVTEHIMPLLAPERKNEWDVMFAHYLGVDHAGHRYGPDHAAMTAKLAQMDQVLRDVVNKLDKDTLLVVMGDHGMDAKGDHGGESDDEVEAALWMYSKKGVFGRASKEEALPPLNAKERPVEQIDLVPTLALLLGLPIPFNNLGKPIKEAFLGKKGNAWDALGRVTRLTAAGIERYQAAYFQARGMTEDVKDGSPRALWEKAVATYGPDVSAKLNAEKWRDGYVLFSAYQKETLRLCRSLWARFDVSSMVQGVTILLASVAILILYIKSLSQDSTAIDDPELDRAEKQLELNGQGEEAKEAVGEDDLTSLLVKRAFAGAGVGLLIGPTTWAAVQDPGSLLDSCLLKAAFGGLFGAAYAFYDALKHISFLRPTLWSWLAIVFTIAPSVGFASNSYTIWEDSILQFFLCTFGILAVASSYRLEDVSNRTVATYHSALFLFLTFVSSASTLCREEQMPFCRSTYYASSTSSTSAPWHLAIPVLIALFLPPLLKSYFQTTKSYAGFAPLWVNVFFRAGLNLNATYWVLNYLDDSSTFANLPAGLLKSTKVFVAQVVVGIATAAIPAFFYAPPCVTISTTTAPSATGKAKATVTVLGYANTHGTLYLLLLTPLILVTLLVTKPMGHLPLASLAWQILCLLDLLDANDLSNSSIGPVILGLLGNYHFFKTGHQAVLSSIQWDSAFIPLETITYPWSPLLVLVNTFPSQLLTALAVPLIPLWKKEPRQKGMLKHVLRALLVFILFHAVIATATMSWAGYLRRHLMLYRIFSPRFMVGALVLGVVHIVALFAWLGSRCVAEKVGGVFGWA